MESIIEKLHLALELDRQAVGIKFISTAEEFSLVNAKQPRVKITYCNLVRLASSGHMYKTNIDGFSCLSAARALGVKEPTAEWKSGKFYLEKNMYRDLEICKKVVDNTTNLTFKSFGIQIGPLPEFSETPDVVIIITNPYNMMRLIQGYTYFYGTYTNYKIIGNQAFCSECTAYPMYSDNVNITLLCSGTRYIAGWNDNEMAIGIPFNKFESLVNGLIATIDTMESDKNKAVIIEKLRNSNIKINIKLKNNYFNGLYVK